MPPSELPPPTLVEDANAFGVLLERLDGQPEVAVDTEADSFFSYREKVCLLQISLGEEDFLVDPLAGFDLDPLGRFLADPKTVKIFHDGEYDVSILKREFEFRFNGLFDTRVAAAALGVQAPGLAAVLAERFGVELDKSMQRSNWAQRPLSEKQISYARLDTHFLVRLMHEQCAELESRDRMVIVESECRRLEKLEPPAVVFDPDEFGRVKGVRALSPKERRVFRELFVLRDSLAEAADSPPFRIMNNQLLLELARHMPRSATKLTRIKGFTPRLARKLGSNVLETIARALELDPIDRLPRIQRRDGTGVLGEDQVELYERLKRWRKGIADETGIEASYLVNRHVLIRIAQKAPKSTRQLEAIEGVHAWQVERYSQGILEVVAQFQEDLARGNLNPRGRSRRR